MPQVCVWRERRQSRLHARVGEPPRQVGLAEHEEGEVGLAETLGRTQSDPTDLTLRLIDHDGLIEILDLARDARLVRMQVEAEAGVSRPGDRLYDVPDTNLEDLPWPEVVSQQGHQESHVAAPVAPQAEGDRGHRLPWQRATAPRGAAHLPAAKGLWRAREPLGSVALERRELKLDRGDHQCGPAGLTIIQKLLHHAPRGRLVVFEWSITLPPALSAPNLQVGPYLLVAAPRQHFRRVVLEDRSHLRVHVA